MQNSSPRVVRVDPAEAHEVIVAEAASIRAADRDALRSSAGVKAVVAGRHRRVGGEDDLRRDAADRFGRLDALGLHPLPHQLERRERAVPFVEMHDAGRDAERRERAHAADAEQQFLADAHAAVAAVEARGQLAVLRAVALDVRIEQQQRVAADGELPDPRGDRAGAGLDA